MSKKSQRAKIKAFVSKQNKYKAKKTQAKVDRVNREISDYFNVDKAFKVSAEHNRELYRSMRGYLKKGYSLKQAAYYTRDYKLYGEITTPQKSVEIKSAVVGIEGRDVKRGLAKLINETLAERSGQGYAMAGRYGQLRLNLSSIGRVNPNALNKDVDDIYSTTRTYKDLVNLSDISIDVDELDNVFTSQLSQTLLSNFFRDESIEHYQAKAVQTWASGSVTVNGQERQLFGRVLTNDERDAITELLNRSEVWRAIQRNAYDSDQIVDHVEKIVENYTSGKIKPADLDSLFAADANNDTNRIDELIKNMLR